MASYVTAHYCNPAPGNDGALGDWFEGTHAAVLRRLRGFMRAERYQITEPQLMKDIAQPWKYATFYDFQLDNPEIHLPALGSFLAEARDDGLVARDGSECIWSYSMFSDWKYSPNWQGRGEFTHVMMLPGNFVPGREVEYHDWYENTHSVEVSNTPGFVGMRRGRLLDEQIEPRSFCPGSELILGALQTHDLGAAQEEFVARAYGKSRSGVAWTPRSTAASMARTVHFFERVSTIK